jgi:hypothetical protein
MNLDTIFGQDDHTNSRVNARVYDNGDTYSGAIDSVTGKRDGSGTFVSFSTGEKYEGEWVNDWKQGHGMEESTTAKYIGTFIDGQKEKGTLIVKNHYTYNGCFNSLNEFHGQGKIVSIAGESYVGEFYKNLKHGVGNQLKPPSTSSSSSLASFHSHLLAAAAAADESEEANIGNDNKGRGGGEIVFQYDGYAGASPEEEYSGEWKFDLRNGVGTLTVKDAFTYSGSFKDGKMDGEGVWLSVDGSEKHEGAFVANVRSGLGILTTKQQHSSDACTRRKVEEQHSSLWRVENHVSQWWRLFRLLQCCATAAWPRSHEVCQQRHLFWPVQEGKAKRERCNRVVRWS